MEEAGFGNRIGRSSRLHEGRPRQRAGRRLRHLLPPETCGTGAKEHTVLHETYEIICETLSEQESGSPLTWSVCRQADRFAAAVLMQPEAFSLLAESSGLDVLALQRAYRCSYASVTLRLAETVREFPLMAVLYERNEDGDPEGWTEPPDLACDRRASHARLRLSRLGASVRNAGRYSHPG